MATVFAEYARNRQGWFFGLRGGQLVLLVAAGGPILWAIQADRWPLAGVLSAAWLLLALLVTVPVRGRSAVGWLLASIGLAAGTVFGWTRWRANAATGQAPDLDTPDLPGALQGIEIHDGPPQGPSNTRFALIQDHARRTWAATAAISHPGLALADAGERDAQAAGLTELLNACARAGSISTLQFQIRSVPDDGAEREQWLARHHHPDAPQLSQQVNREIAATLSQASVRTEAFCTVVVPESRLARLAKEYGHGVASRGRAMATLLAEVEALLRSGMRVSAVDWLTSQQLAAAVRTGFAPADRAGLVDAAAEQRTDPTVNSTVPWAHTAASGAETVARHYVHDAWCSIAATITLPARGAVLGALAPVLVPTEPQERRCLLVVFPVVTQTVADRQSQSVEWSADLAEALRARAGMKTRAKDRAAIGRARELDVKIASGNALVLPYAVACVTVPSTMRIAEFGRRLDTSIRRAGYAPLRLDLAQDSAVAAATIPLGVNLDHRTTQ